MPHIFIPKLGLNIKLKTDWFARISYCYDNAKMLRLIDPTYGYGQSSPKAEYCFDAETVFKVGKCLSVYTYDRLDSDVILLTIMRSPDRRILPKKDGGTHSGRLSFYVSIDMINGLDVEMVEN